MTDYDSRIEWLFSQFPSYQKVGGKAYKPGLETMEKFDLLLGQPHRLYKTIHIAGTNGKGSTSHMLAAGLAACGYKVGLYTSPHLLDFRERIKIVQSGSFRMIDRGSVYDFITEHQSFFEREHPSFFEITTAMAFDYFATEKVDFAVIETGLGGRLDSTNVISPVLSVITNIGLEHCEHLGNTLEEIAFEKAGIIKPGVPVVIGEALSETRPVFEEKARETGSRIVFAQEDENFLKLDVREMDLKGDYQKRNIVTLSSAARLLAVDRAAFENGVRNAASVTGLRGRWETLRNAGEGKAAVICDTGHNAHGLRWVAEQVDRVSCDYRNLFFIFGVMRDKDIDSIAARLPHNVNYIMTQASTPRALPAVELANILSDHGINGRVVPTVKGALELAEELASEKDLIFIGGSNFVIAEILGLF